MPALPAYLPAITHFPPPTNTPKIYPWPHQAKPNPLPSLRPSLVIASPAKQSGGAGQPNISLRKLATPHDIWICFPIFAKKWFAFSLAARHNVGNNSPSQARHRSTVKRHLTPNNRFQNTPKTTYVKCSTIARTTLPQTLARMDGERMRRLHAPLPLFSQRSSCDKNVPLNLFPPEASSWLTNYP